jgi:uracil-DNA glycosylase family 4
MTSLGNLEIYKMYQELAVLEEEIAACRLCAEQGYFAVTRPIERGQAQKRIWLIGQAPGLHEGTRMLAFSGPAGRTLMSWFARCGVPEEQVRRDFYLSAITKCYPGRVAASSGDRNPTPAERINCRPFLLRELAILQPQLVILVGSTALKEVYGNALKLESLIGVPRTMPLTELYQRLTARLPKTAIIPLFSSDLTAEIHHLPHPSGASRWLNLPENKLLLNNALEKLNQALENFGFYQEG